MKNVVLTIIGFGIAIALVVGVIVPLASQGRDTGLKAIDNYGTVDATITTLSGEIE